METNINAFYMDVQEKEAAVSAAKAELERAENVLKAHPDYEAPEKARKIETGVEDTATKKDSDLKNDEKPKNADTHEDRDRENHMSRPVDPSKRDK